MELRDRDTRYHGLGVSTAAGNIVNVIGETVLFENALEQRKIDRLMIDADGTENKEKLGANAILGVSMAVARAAAEGLHIPLYRYLGGIGASTLPVPMMNILNGGRHADNTVDLQEFMIMPVGASGFSEGLRMCSEMIMVSSQPSNSGTSFIRFLSVILYISISSILCQVIRIFILFFCLTSFVRQYVFV